MGLLGLSAKKVPKNTQMASYEVPGAMAEDEADNKGRGGNITTNNGRDRKDAEDMCQKQEERGLRVVSTIKMSILSGLKAAGAASKLMFTGGENEEIWGTGIHAILDGEAGSSTDVREIGMQPRAGRKDPGGLGIQGILSLEGGGEELKIGHATTSYVDTSQDSLERERGESISDAEVTGEAQLDSGEFQKTIFGWGGKDADSSSSKEGEGVELSQHMQSALTDNISQQSERRLGPAYRGPELPVVHFGIGRATTQGVQNAPRRIWSSFRAGNSLVGESGGELNWGSREEYPTVIFAPTSFCSIYLIYLYTFPRTYNATNI